MRYYNIMGKKKHLNVIYFDVTFQIFMNSSDAFYYLNINVN